jgi:hypothetical protein
VTLEKGLIINLHSHGHKNVGTSILWVYFTTLFVGSLELHFTTLSVTLFNTYLKTLCVSSSVI